MGIKPLRDRILFVGWDGNRFILLHYFMKKTQKTPKREIEQAKRNIEILLKGALKMSKTKVSPIGSSWDEFEKRTFTPEEIMESDLRVALISELIRARNDQGITQK